MEFHRFSLTNGVRVIIIPLSSAGPVALHGWFSCGSRVEEDREIGLAHFNEHMFFRGGLDFPDFASVYRELRLLGDYSNAMTSEEMVIYFIVTGSAYLERAAHLLSDMLIHARFDEADTEKERGAIILELKQSADDPNWLSHQEFSRLLFGSHPLGRAVVDALDSVARFSSADVKGFKERFYGPPNMVISVTGGVDACRARELLERYFGAIPAKNKTAWIEFVPGARPMPAKLFKKRSFKQAYLRVGGFAPSYLSPDLSVFQVLCKILDNRLWFKIRCEHGLAYAVDCETHLFADVGALVAVTEVSPERAEIEKAFELIFREMQSIREGDVTEAECEESKTAHLVGLDLSLASVDGAGFFFGGNELLRGEAYSVAEAHRKIEAVTKEQVIGLSRELWKEEDVYSLLLAPSFPRFERTYCRLRSILR